MLDAMETNKRTPLYDFHVAHGARMVPFAGWDMPVQYSSIIEEHKAVRNTAGLFDVSHMGEVWISGPEAEIFLDQLVTNHVAPLPIGKALYALMCYEDGGVVDDLIIYRWAPDRFLLVINAGNIEKDVEWIETKAVGMDCTVRHASDQFAQLALQGPQASNIMAAAGAQDIEKLGRFRCIESELLSVPVLAARTGYTGEDGYEFYLAPDRAVELTEGLLSAGGDFGLQLVGLGARDSLRLEAGFPLYGHEISASINPLVAGLGWVVKMNKPHRFIGCESLKKYADAGLKHKVVWFKTNDRRIARAGSEVLYGDRVVGKVLSGTLSPVLNQPIGSALIETNEVNMDALEVELRKHRIPLIVTHPPLHSKPTA